MSKRIGITSSISSEDMYPSYDFFVYDDNEDMICVNMEEECAPRRKRAHKLSPQMMDMMTDKEIEEWYEYNGRCNDDY